MSTETCQVTVWRTIPPAYNGGRGERVLNSGPCGEPIARHGLCERHAADKERLS